MTHIIFLMPYHGIEKVVEEAFAEREDSGGVTYEAIVAQASRIPPLNLREEDIIISRGFTTLALNRRGAINLELKITGYDVIAAAAKCVTKFGSGKIAVVGTPSMIYGAEAIGRLYSDVEVACFSVKTEDALPAVMEELAAKGFRSVVGGRSAAMAAKKKGLKSVLIESGKEAVAKAIDEAIRLVEVRRNERAETERMRAIMNYTFEGIISTVIDVVTCLRKPDESSMGGGVYLIARSENAYSQHILATKGCLSNRDGSISLIYRPYHLCGVEASTSLLCAGLAGISTGLRDYAQRFDIVQTALADLKAGDVMGNDHDVRLKTTMVPMSPVAARGPIPAHMLSGRALNRDVAAGTVITYDMIDAPAGSVLWRLRAEQDRLSAK